MSIPLFPKCLPRQTDASWFDVDQPCNDEEEVAQLEKEHQEWLDSILQSNSDLLPIGKTSSDSVEDEEDDDEDDDNDDDDDSTSHDEEEEDEIEIEAGQERRPVRSPEF